MTKSSTQISGVLTIDKPAGITSHDVVDSIRKVLKVGLPAEASAKVGHAGTLDPFATGILIVAIGSATRLLEYTHTFAKTYEAEITLGATSDTDDVTGVITPRTGETPGVSKKTPGVKEVRDTLAHFAGPIQQIPPQYAAIKINGKKMYELARAGGEVKAPPRSVTIHSIKLLHYKYPELNLRVVCSTGTYIRALARDIGQALHTGGYCSQLRRTTIGPFTLDKSIQLKKLSTPSLSSHHLPMERLISHLPSHTLSDNNVAKLKMGQAIEVKTSFPEDQPIALFDDQKNLVGIGEYQDSPPLLKPIKIL